MPVDPRWLLRGRRLLYESGWFNVNQDEVTLPTGEDITYTFIDHPGYAMVLPITDDGHAIMVDVYRYPLSDHSLECPAGGLDGRSPQETVKAELEEETGHTANAFHSLGSYRGSPGCSNEVFHLFVATGASPDGVIAHEITEQIQVRRYPVAELKRMALEGEIPGGPSTLCILLASAAGHLDAGAE